jgi:hypothetical protein
MRTPWKNAQAYRKKQKAIVVIGVIGVLASPLPFIAGTYFTGSAWFTFLYPLAFVGVLIFAGLRDCYRWFKNRRYPRVITREGRVLWRYIDDKGNVSYR